MTRNYHNEKLIKKITLIHILFNVEKRDRINIINGMSGKIEKISRTYVCTQ